MKEEWIPALKAMTYGIYVLTSSHKEKINGMIASWVSQVSYDPLLIMVAVHTNRYSHQLIDQGGCLALHVLARNQADLLKRFKGSDPEAKFAGLQWQRGKTGCPVLADCIAYFEGRIADRFRPGNHTLFFAEVVDARVVAEKRPLTSLDYDGVYLGQH
ncbi:MAG: flavin reductase [Deltaproteobacteria bacterium]|jgi:flavin reductase (DIM6/NTAB) family NADH-FMN oxidoreductase RutF|nr:flavin reductase [Deltaproteobacteria bacterium]MBW2482292.1 flavin reductase [Deltaproteobacteria bacterium]